MSNRNNENNNNNNKRAKSPSELSDDGNNSKQTTPDHGTPYNNIENDNSHTKRARLAEQHQHDELKVATKKEEDAYPTTTTTSTATTDTEEREEKIANKTEEAAGAVAVAAGAGATTTTTTTTSRSSSSSVSSSSSSCVVLIPVEVVNIIFSFMDADTLFPSCIWVCVQWRRLAFAQFKPTTPPPATATGTTTTATTTTTPHNNHQNSSSSSSSSSSSRNNNNNNYSGALWNPDSINNSFIRYIASQEMLGGFLKDIITFRLSFELCWRVDDRGLKHLQRIAGAIAHLNLNYCYQISDKGLVDNLLMPPNAAKSDYCLSQLESLSLVCLDKITDRSVAAIAARCPRLRSLNLAMCTGITKRGLRELGALKQLRCLNLQQRNTFEISDRAVEKLRKNTLPVDCIVITQ